MVSKLHLQSYLMNTFTVKVLVC